MQLNLFEDISETNIPHKSYHTINNTDTQKIIHQIRKQKEIRKNHEQKLNHLITKNNTLKNKLQAIYTQQIGLILRIEKVQNKLDQSNQQLAATVTDLQKTLRKDKVGQNTIDTLIQQIKI